MKWLNIILLLSALNCFSQKSKGVKVSGRVYLNMTRSSGVINGPSRTEPEQLFRNQAIYFSNDSAKAVTMTDSNGLYTVSLPPGVYQVTQGQAQSEQTKGLTSFGTYWLTVSETGKNYDIYFENTVNGRKASMKNGIMLPKK